MRNISILLCFACLIFLADSIHAQEVSKSRSIGVQLNPYLDSFFFEGTFTKPVFAGRYGFNLNDHLSLGPEVSGYFIHWNSDQGDMNISDFNLGGFVRYSLLPTSRIKPFFEFSPYYTFYHFKSNTIQTQEGIGKEYDKTYLSGYLSPGISLYSKNHKFSLDLMYKFSNKTLVTGNKSAFTYRLNFNF
jgi:hypothetical protein